MGAVFVAMMMAVGVCRAGRMLHLGLLTNVLRKPMMFFDTVPSGRILNRFSLDLEMVDCDMPEKVAGLLECVFECVGILLVISLSTPLFLSSLLPLAISYWLLQVIGYSSTHTITAISSPTIQDKSTTQSAKCLKHNSPSMCCYIAVC